MSDTAKEAPKLENLLDAYSVSSVDLMSLAAGAGLAAVLILVICGLWHKLRCCLQWCCSSGESRDLESRGALLDASVQRSDRSHDARDPFKRSAKTAAGPSGEPQDFTPAAAASMPNWSLKGRVAIVTGGSKGLGRAIVDELLSQGCEVLTCARDITPLAELVKSDPRLVAVAADVSTPAGRGVLLATLRRRFAFKLDILVNNVGTNLRKPSERYSDAEYDDLCATNQGSAFHLSRACYEALKPRRGCIINISSVSGSTVDSTGCPYHMNKAALEHMTRYLACEWGAEGIRVNAVAPWFINTPLTAPLLADSRFHDAVRRATPMKRVGEPHEVACVVAFLAMPAAGYVSGQVIGIDGAMVQEGFKYVR